MYSCQVAEHILKLVTLDHGIEVHGCKGGWLESIWGTEETDWEKDHSDEDREDPHHGPHEDRSCMNQGLQDKGVFGWIIEVLNESEPGEGTSEAAHVLWYMKTERGFEDEEECREDLNDIPKECENWPVPEKASLVSPCYLFKIDIAF